MSKLKAAVFLPEVHYLSRPPGLRRLRSFALSPGCTSQMRSSILCLDCYRLRSSGFGFGSVGVGVPVFGFAVLRKSVALEDMMDVDGFLLMYD